jgi:hypothetical protein
VGGNNSFDWRITRHAHFWPHRQGRQQLWPRTTKLYDRSSDAIRLDDDLERPRVGCAFVDDRCAVGIRLKAEVAIVREYGENCGGFCQNLAPLLVMGLAHDETAGQPLARPSFGRRGDRLGRRDRPSSRYRRRPAAYSAGTRAHGGYACRPGDPHQRSRGTGRICRPGERVFRGERLQSCH